MHLPFPVPSSDGHYQEFIEAYTNPSSSEEHRPSASAKRPEKVFLFQLVCNMPKTQTSWYNAKNVLCSA